MSAVMQPHGEGPHDLRLVSEPVYLEITTHHQIKKWKEFIVRNNIPNADVRNWYINERAREAITLRFTALWLTDDTALDRGMKDSLDPNAGFNGWMKWDDKTLFRALEAAFPAEGTSSNQADTLAVTLPSIVFDLKNGLEGISAYEHKLQKAKDTFRQAWDKLTPAEVENWLIRPLCRNPNLHHSYGRFQEKVRTHLQTLQDSRPDYVKNGEVTQLVTW